jgi:hypothetical protein
VPPPPFLCFVAAFDGSFFSLAVEGAGSEGGAAHARVDPVRARRGVDEAAARRSYTKGKKKENGFCARRALVSFLVAAVLCHRAPRGAQCSAATTATMTACVGAACAALTNGFLKRRRKKIVFGCRLFRVRAVVVVVIASPRMQNIPAVIVFVFVVIIIIASRARS